MKTPVTKPLLLGCFGIAIATLLSNCVDPYYAGNHGQQQQRVTAYRSGYEVRSLPPGYRTETIGGTRYYNHNGTYYRPESGRYVVVDAPRPRYGGPHGHQDVTITRLPRGYREVNYRGQRYYQSNNVYYQQRGSAYIIVNRPY